MLYRRYVRHSLRAEVTGDINDVNTLSQSLEIKEGSANIGQYIDIDLTRL